MAPCLVMKKMHRSCPEAIGLGVRGEVRCYNVCTARFLQGTCKHPPQVQSFYNRGTKNWPGRKYEADSCWEIRIVLHKEGLNYHSSRQNHAHILLSGLRHRY